MDGTNMKISVVRKTAVVVVVAHAWRWRMRACRTYSSIGSETFLLTKEVLPPFPAWGRWFRYMYMYTITNWTRASSFICTQSIAHTTGEAHNKILYRTEYIVQMKRRTASNKFTTTTLAECSRLRLLVCLCLFVRSPRGGRDTERAAVQKKASGLLRLFCRTAVNETSEFFTHQAGTLITPCCAWCYVAYRNCYYYYWYTAASYLLVGYLYRYNRPIHGFCLPCLILISTVGA